MNNFNKDIHTKYVLNWDKNKDLLSIGFFLRDHLKIPGAYWSITSLNLLKIKLEIEKKLELIKWIFECFNEDGGFGGNVGHDSHITCTHYALLLLFQFGIIQNSFKGYKNFELYKEDCLDNDEFNNLKNKFNNEMEEKIVNYVLNLYINNGSVKGDKYGEVDLRFIYNFVAILKLLKRENKIEKSKIIEYILKCQNNDGGLGGEIMAESHSAYMFCAFGALSILYNLNNDNWEPITFEKTNFNDSLYFLSQRQTTLGGFNGRPEKLADVCYSWWVLSTLCIIDKKNAVDLDKLTNFINSCQDLEDGGFGDRPDNGTDIFHTFFSLGSLSIIDNEKHNLMKIDPTFAIPIIN